MKAVLGAVPFYFELENMPILICHVSSLWAFFLLFFWSFAYIPDHVRFCFSSNAV